MVHSNWFHDKINQEIYNTYMGERSKFPKPWTFETTILKNLQYAH